MTLFRVAKDDRKLNKVESASYAQEGWKERQDLQALIRDNPEAIDANLFVVAEEFSSWIDSKRRIDLLGLVRDDSDTIDANLVIIELKRNEDGGHMELQALRYAAMASAMDFDAIVRAYEEHLAKKKEEWSLARDTIMDFLGLEDLSSPVSIGTSPRIILISEGFSPEITTAVLWLNAQGLNIRCIEASLYKLGTEEYLDIEQIIPLPSASEYQIQIENKTRNVVKGSSKSPTTMKILLERDSIKAGTRLYLYKLPQQNLVIPDNAPDARYATVIGAPGENVIWEHDKKPYSLTALCKEICKLCGDDLGAQKPYPGPSYWSLDTNRNVSLAELAKKAEP